MKILVGIDDSKRHNAPLSLIARMRFYPVEVELANVVPTVESYASLYGAQVALNYEEIARNLTEGAHVMLDQASDDACRHGLKVSTHVMSGAKAEADR